MTVKLSEVPIKLNDYPRPGRKKKSAISVHATHDATSEVVPQGFIFTDQAKPQPRRPGVQDKVWLLSQDKPIETLACPEETRGDREGMRRSGPGVCGRVVSTERTRVSPPPPPPPPRTPCAGARLGGWGKRGGACGRTCEDSEDVPPGCVCVCVCGLTSPPLPPPPPPPGGVLSPGRRSWRVPARRGKSEGPGGPGGAGRPNTGRQTARVTILETLTLLEEEGGRGAGGPGAHAPSGPTNVPASSELRAPRGPPG